MNEQGFITFHYLTAAAETVYYAVCLAAFLRPFLSPGSRSGNRQGTGRPTTCSSLSPDSDPAQKRHLRRSYALVFLIYSSVFLAGLALPGSGWMYMVATALLLLTCSGFLGIGRKLLLLLCTLFFCIRNLCALIMTSAEYFSSGFFLAGADTPEKTFLMAAVNYALNAVLQLALFSLMLYLVGRQLRRNGLELHLRELGYLLLMPVAGILFVNISIRLLIVNDDGHIFRLYQQIPVSLEILPTVAALLYAGILATIASCQKNLALQRERNQSLMEQRQLSAIRQRIEQLEQAYGDIRRMKHEMRGHLTNIKGLAENGRYQDIDYYIARMDESMSLLDLNIHTGNAVTDVIINDKQRAAARQGIEFRSDFHYPVSGGYDAYDIGIILSNLLQNALEACRDMDGQKGYIQLSGKQKKNFFLIEVRNPFVGEIRFDPHTQLPVSTKEDGEEESSGLSSPIHGIGLSNVKKETEKYGGNMDIRAEGQEFRVTVLLQGKSAHDGFPGT